MFHRILVEEWQSALSMMSFIIFFFVFTATAIRVSRMPRRSVEHMESLPLLDDTRSSEVRNHE